MAHKFSQVVHWFLSQLLRQTSLLTLFGDSDARLLFTMSSETENNLSHGTVEAGGTNYRTTGLVSK